MPEIYTRHGINFDSLSHLESIGLIQHNSLSNFAQASLPKHTVVYYYDRRLLLGMPRDNENYLVIGKALFTNIGQELAPICPSKPVAGFYEYVKDKWKQYLPKTE